MTDLHTAAREALAPCPFCGGAAEFERMGTPRQSCIVVCGNCGARHESSDEGEKCGQSWNARAALDAGQAQPVATRELPDDIRVPLHRIWADAAYLIGRAKLGDEDLAVHTLKALADEVERRVLDSLYTAPQAAQPVAPAGVVVTKIDPGFRWDSEAQHHVPNLLIEFTPVKPDQGRSAKGWKDRDAVSAMLSAAPPAPAAQPLTEEHHRALREQARQSPEAEHTVWWLLYGRLVERAHGIGAHP